MKPFILSFAEAKVTNVETLELEYSDALQLNVLPGTSTPAISLTVPNPDTFTRVAKESTDHQRVISSNSLRGDTFTKAQEGTDTAGLNSAESYLGGETHTLVARENTDQISRRSHIARRMSLETLTEARESTDVR